MKIRRVCRLVVLTLFLAGSLCFFEVPGYSSVDQNSLLKEESPDKVMLLEELLQRALLANRTLQQNALQVESRQYSLRSAESEFDWKFQPSANVGISGRSNTSAQTRGVSGKISKKNSLGVEASVTPSITYREASGSAGGVGASLSIPLFRGFGREFNYDAVHAADFSLATSTRNMYLSEVEIVLETVTLVYEILRQQALVNLFSLQEKRFKGHVHRASIMEDTGLSSPIDTYRARIRLGDVQEQLTVAREKHRASLDRLKVLLAYPVESALKVKAPLSYAPTRISDKKAIEIALENRIELEQSGADLLESERKSRVAKRGLLPDIKLVGTYRRKTFPGDFSEFDVDSDEYWSIGLTSSTDFSRTREKAIYQQSLLEVRRKKLQLQTRSDEIISEVKNRLDALKQEEQRIALRQDQIIQAKGKMRLAEIKFSHGMGDNFDLLESEIEYQQAKTNVLSEKNAYIVGQYRLRAALGTLLAR